MTEQVFVISSYENGAFSEVEITPNAPEMPIFLQKAVLNTPLLVSFKRYSWPIVHKIGDPNVKKQGSDTLFYHPKLC